jgi:Uma2 family endonuclease
VSATPNRGPEKLLATWEDLERTPEDARVYEVIAGEIVAQPRPMPEHGLVQINLGADLSPFFRGRGGPGGWWLVMEPEVVLAAHEVVVPDLAGWRRSRLPELPSRRFDIVPDWVCEVLSPANARHDRIVKANLYLRAGLPYFWLIAPPERTLEAWASREGTWVRVGAFTDGDVVRIPPFDAVEIDVGSLFAPRAASPEGPGQP